MIRSAFRLSSKVALRSRFYSHTAPCCVGEAREKFRDVLEEYRLANYQNELPSRFVKELLHAADENKDGFLEKHEFQHLLANIGAKDKLSSEELDEIVVEALGEDPKDDPKIPMDRIKSILMAQFAKKP